MNPNDWLTHKQFEALLNLYNEYNDAFLTLPSHVKAAFYARLYSKS